MPRRQKLQLDEAKLAELWPKLTLPELAAEFRCSLNTIYKRAGQLNLPPKMSFRVRRPRRNRDGEYVKPPPAERRVIPPPKMIAGLTLARLRAGR